MTLADQRRQLIVVKGVLGPSEHLIRIEWLSERVLWTKKLK
jgi:hypothetical protein